jgi:hypothetical protein
MIFSEALSALPRIYGEEQRERSFKTASIVRDHQTPAVARSGPHIAPQNRKKWRATADEEGHLYEASLVKRFFALSCFPRGLCLHSWHDGPLLGRAFAVKPQRPAGVAPLGARA